MILSSKKHEFRIKLALFYEIIINIFQQNIECIRMEHILYYCIIIYYNLILWVFCTCACVVFSEQILTRSLFPSHSRDCKYNVCVYIITIMRVCDTLWLCLPHEMGRHIVFSSVVCLSVRPSVRPSIRPSHFRVRSISFEPLVGFTNNFAQMSSMMRRCAVFMFDQGWVKVKVTI